jgi:hypothetical protein
MLVFLWISSANKKQGRPKPPRFNIANLGNMRFVDSYCLGEHRHKPLIPRIKIRNSAKVIKKRRAIKPDGDRVTPILIMENGGKVCVSALPPYFSPPYVAAQPESRVLRSARQQPILYNSFKIGKKVIL